MPNSRFCKKGFEAAFAISTAIFFIGTELATMIGYDLLNLSNCSELYQHFLNQVYAGLCRSSIELSPSKNAS